MVLPSCSEHAREGSRRSQKGNHINRHHVQTDTAPPPSPPPSARPQLSCPARAPRPVPAPPSRPRVCRFVQLDKMASMAQLMSIVNHQKHVSAKLNGCSGVCVVGATAGLNTDPHAMGERSAAAATRLRTRPLRPAWRLPCVPARGCFLHRSPAPCCPAAHSPLLRVPLAWPSPTRAGSQDQEQPAAAPADECRKERPRHVKQRSVLLFCADRGRERCLDHGRACTSLCALRALFSRRSPL